MYCNLCLGHAGLPAACRCYANAAVLVLAVVLILNAAEALSSDDLLGTKVWLDQHLFNMTLKTTKLQGGRKVWMMNEEKAAERQLPWPPTSQPTLCFLGLGPSSIEYLATLVEYFPELHVALFEVQDESWLQTLGELLGSGRSSTAIERANYEEFTEARGRQRRTCGAISWSVDTPPFSFHRYRELLYSGAYMLVFFNMQGCTSETRTEAADKYYCEYLYSSYKATLCGQVNESRSADYFGESLYFPLVNSACTDNLCMCHAESNTFIDFHFEHLCRKGEQHRFMAQWGQDRFLLDNVFSNDPSRQQGIYVDIGASHPFHLSNTVYFDHCLDWKGLCVEPNPRMKPALRAMRSCLVEPACVWANSTTMRFNNGAELASMTDDDSLLPSEPYEVSHESLGNTYFEAECKTLHELLLRSLPGAAGRSSGRRIDILSVDAEGAEIEIFKDFPFHEWDIRTVVIETSRRSAMAIDGLLLPQGFLKVAVLGKDAVYVHRSVASWLPTDGLILPERIIWNEPGTEADTIDYYRFQRLFGVDGELDDDVGDQRLQNATELEKQHRRLNASSSAEAAEVLNSARSALLGGILSDEQRQIMEQPWVRDLLSDFEVKAALATLDTDEVEFQRLLQSSPRLKASIGHLLRAGVFRLTQNKYSAEDQ